MFRRMKSGAKLILGLHSPGRNLTVFPDDVFIVSYPKSGNTWTRFLIGNLIHPEAPADFSNINQIIPDPEGMSKRKLARVPRPRFIKSHQYFDPRYRRVIYIVRDPRDVALSQYHFHRKRKVLQDGSPVEEFVSRFVKGETTPYGSWGENVGSWMVTRNGTAQFLLIRYEDLISDAMREMARVAAFLGVHASPALLAQAVSRSSAESMRKLERAQSLMWSSTKETRQDIPFVRAARSGGWRSELPQKALQEIEMAWGPQMKSLGYELLFGAVDEALRGAEFAISGLPR